MTEQAARIAPQYWRGHALAGLLTVLVTATAAAEPTTAPPLMVGAADAVHTAFCSSPMRAEAGAEDASARRLLIHSPGKCLLAGIRQ
ncbi:hypothetical protein [Xanthomonas maliensis]|uniref:hypothetical protein n=1 Tax=Xanthomonas maliensis TaxID=1321368 RepID=UPI0003A6D37D|nr:hypothetical protein [Xanthomonas maliensis]KAB7771837.1 hypothetical protein CKY51_02120 [Xanthomonas maliensis]